MYFVSESLKANIGIDGVSVNGAAVVTETAVLDKLNLKGSAQGPLVFLTKLSKTTDTDAVISKLVVTHSDSATGTFEEIAVAEMVSYLNDENGTNVDITQSEKIKLIGIKEDLLKRYFKIAVTTTSTAAAVLNLDIIQGILGE